MFTPLLLNNEQPNIFDSFTLLYYIDLCWQQYLTMRKQTRVLIIIIVGTLLLSFLLPFLKTIFQEKDNPLEDYLFSLALGVLIVSLALVLGLIFWTIFKRIKSEKIFYFIVFNLCGLIFLAFADLKVAYSFWHYNKYQSNIDYNESLTKNGSYLDTCIIMVQNDLKSGGLSSNDFRILSYSYDQTLCKVPRDTTNRYYSFEILYLKNRNDNKTTRTASYFINFNQKIKRLYDVDTKNEKAKKQIESLRQNLKDLKNVLAKYPDSSDSHFDVLKEKLKVVD